MHPSVPPSQSAGARNLLFIERPDLWLAWPFLPVVKRLPELPLEYGVLFDAMGSSNLPGYSATVFLTNLFLMPRQLNRFLSLPKEVFDTREELVQAGWCVD